MYVDRNGASQPVTPERRNFHHPQFSPDGRRLALDFTSVEGRNVWILDRAEGTLSRATFDRDGHDATWTPDGRFLTYIVPVNRPGSVLLVLLRKRPGSAETPDTLLASPLLAYTGTWLRDGSALVTTAADVRAGGDPARPDSTPSGGPGTDAAIVRNAGKGPLQALVASRFNESFVGVSPDGRWLRALDVGCGALGWLRILSEWVGPSGQVVGADIDEPIFLMPLVPFWRQKKGSPTWSSPSMIFSTASWSPSPSISSTPAT